MNDILIHCPVFKGLTEEEIENLMAESHHFTRKFSAGEAIAFSGDPCDHLMCVIEGSVKGEMVDYSGRVIKIEDIRAPRMLATAFIFGKENRFPVNIVANEKCRILFIPRSGFIGMLQGNATILKNFLNTISSRAQFLSDKIKFLSFKTIKAKLIQYLLRISDERDVFEMPISQTALAELFGVTRPALARVIHDMHESGIVSINRRMVKIHDRNMLQHILREV